MGYLRSAAGALPKTRRFTVGEGEQRHAGHGIGGRFHQIETIETALASAEDRFHVLRRFVQIPGFQPVALPARRHRGTIATRHGDVGIGGWRYLGVEGGGAELRKDRNKLKRLRSDGHSRVEIPWSPRAVSGGGGETGSGETTKFVRQAIISGDRPKITTPRRPQAKNYHASGREPRGFPK